MDILARIKRLVAQGNISFTRKAELEMLIDHLTPGLVCEAIMNAPAIAKKVRSKNPRTGIREMLYVIEGFTVDGMSIYTKGKIEKLERKEVFYVIISSKRSTD
jgi:hypothetical protein